MHRAVPCRFAVLVFTLCFSFIINSRAYARELFAPDQRLPNPLQGGPRPTSMPWDERSLRGPADIVGGAAPWMPESFSGGPVVTVPLYGCPSADYVAPVQVGNQGFYAIVDTGSTDFAVASDYCSGCQVAPAYRLTGVDHHQRVEAHYGSGSWKGDLVEDYVGISGAPVVPMRFADILEQQTFFHRSNCILGADTASLNQAILGMGPDTLLTESFTSYFSSVADQLYDNAFSFTLCDNNGQMQLGGYTEDTVTQAPFWTPMVSPQRFPFFAVAMLGVDVAGQPTGVTLQDLGPTVVDTGTSAFIVPNSVHKQLVQAIEQASGGYIPALLLSQPGQCMALEPGVTAAMIDQHAPPLTLHFYNPAQPDAPFSMQSSATASYIAVRTAVDGTQFACSMLVPSGDSSLTVLGNTMMRGYNVIFNLKNWWLGVAPSAVCQR